MISIGWFYLIPLAITIGYSLGNMNNPAAMRGDIDWFGDGSEQEQLINCIIILVGGSTVMGLNAFIFGL